MLPLGGAAAPRRTDAVFQADRVNRFYDGYAAEREQAPSPQKQVGISLRYTDPSNEGFHRYTEALGQPADLPQIELTLTAQNFRYHRLSTNARQVALAHAMFTECGKHPEISCSS